MPDSNFEIDDNANLKVDVEGHLDWASVDEDRNDDEPTGQKDDSFAGGSKEDDPCPATTDGSIPNNKSDLLWFGAYKELGVGGAGFLHLFWSRVQDPSGTTLMDFELNQSDTACAEGRPNRVRTDGDILLEYRIEQGGAKAQILAREWDGTAMAWGAAQDLTAINAATGTINSTAILAADSDGLGAHSPRTFGEASIDLDYIFEPGKCKSFGSAFLKSRSSDSFTSQLKDFITPVPIELSNCGKVTIRKETDPDGLAGSFTFTHNLQTDPAQTSSTFDLKDGESKTFTNVLLGTGYTVTESALASGFDLSKIECTAKGVTPTTSVPDKKVSFDFDDATDELDCTFTNRARGTITIVKVSTDGTGTFDFTSTLLGPFSLTTTAAGTAGKASKTFSDLVPGDYAVAETDEPGWNLQSATCSDGSLVSKIELAAGETVTCTFTNVQERGAIVVQKTRKHAAAGPMSQPHAGVTFTVSGGGLSTPVFNSTDLTGTVCFSGLLYGKYYVTETVPSGYRADGFAVGVPATKEVTVDTEGTCAAGAESVLFSNTPLTKITVSVDSLIDGGTKTKITCGTDEVTTGSNGDGTLTLNDQLPGVYTCTIDVDP